MAVARTGKLPRVHRPALAHFATKIESSTDKPHTTFAMCCRARDEGVIRPCLPEPLGEFLSQEGVWLVRTLLRLGDPQVTVYVHMNERPPKIWLSATR